MIRRLLTTALDAGTLSRTVLVLSRQLDNAHLLAASEEARADRAELRVAELEAQTRDWAELSGELAREQPTADPLPSVLDAGEAPIPLVLTDSAREADIQRDRADALQRALQACEVELQQTRAQLRQTEAAAGAHIATISALREAIAAAHRAAHAIAPAEQIPGVAAADDIPDGYWAARAERRERRAAIDAARTVAGTDDSPPTRPSERTRTT